MELHHDVRGKRKSFVLVVICIQEKKVLSDGPIVSRVGEELDFWLFSIYASGSINIGLEILQGLTKLLGNIHVSEEDWLCHR